MGRGTEPLQRPGRRQALHTRRCPNVRMETHYLPLPGATREYRLDPQPAAPLDRQGYRVQGWGCVWMRLWEQKSVQPLWRLSSSTHSCPVVPRALGGREDSAGTDPGSGCTSPEASDTGSPVHPLRGVFSSLKVLPNTARSYRRWSPGSSLWKRLQRSLRPTPLPH